MLTEEHFNNVKLLQKRGLNVPEIAQVTKLGKSTINKIFNEADYADHRKQVAEDHKLKVAAAQIEMPVEQPLTEAAEAAPTVEANMALMDLLGEILAELKSLNAKW